MPIPLPAKPANGATINTGHAMASGLVRCILYNEGSGSPVELVGTASGTLVGSASWATDTNLGGTCLDTSVTTGDGVNWAANGLSYGNADCSVFIAGRIPTIAARQHVAAEAAGGTTDGGVCGLGDSGPMQFVLADVVALDSGAGGLTVADIYTIGYAFDRGVGVLFHGKNQTADTTITDSVANASAPTASANPSPTSNRRSFASAWDDRLAFIYIWNRALVAADFVSLHLDPYQFISTGGRSDRPVPSPRWCVRRPV